MDVLKASGKDIDHEQHETYEVYYLPYEPNLRDRIYSKYGDQRYTLMRKLLSLWELLTQNFNSAVLPYRNLNQFAEQYLLKNPEVTRMIITANPFPLFKFGYLLKKKFSIKWIADYRDDWSTTEIDKPTSLAQRLLARINSYYERKWVGSAECITSISDYYTDKISTFVNKPGHTIYNGYNELPTATAEPSLFQDFTITYCGTLYARQNIELFLDALKKLIDHAEDKLSIKLHLSGISFFDATQTDRVMNYMKDYSDNLIVVDRLPKAEMIEVEKRSHLLLMMGHTRLKGITSSKLYEYISFRKPVLLCPPDGDLMESILKRTGLGLYANSSEEAYVILDKFYHDFLNSIQISVEVNEEGLKALSARNQTHKMAEILSTL